MIGWTEMFIFGKRKFSCGKEEFVIKEATFIPIRELVYVKRVEEYKSIYIPPWCCCIFIADIM
jgi:hypothetical protein